jgi:uncharacterized Zn finger protein
MKIIQWLKNILNPKVVQRTFVYCDCGNELIASKSFVSDTYDENGDNHVLYKCTQCGQEQDWNFDIAPVPINWSKLRSEPVVVSRTVVSQPQADIKVTDLELSESARQALTTSAAKLPQCI